MIGKVETINGVKQITPLDDTLIPNISPSTPNNSILQYENGVVKSAGYTINEIPIKHDLTGSITAGWAYLENAIPELLNNTGARYLTEGKVYEGIIAATSQFSGTYQIYSFSTNSYLAITGVVSNSTLKAQFWGTYNPTDGWVIKTNTVYTYNGSITTDGSGNALIAANSVGPIPRTDIEIVSARSPTNNVPIMVTTDAGANVYGRVTGWGDWTPLVNTTIDVVIQYRLL